MGGAGGGGGEVGGIKKNEYRTYDFNKIIIIKLIIEKKEYRTYDLKK